MPAGLGLTSRRARAGGPNPVPTPRHGAAAPEAAARRAGGAAAVPGRRAAGARAGRAGRCCWASAKWAISVLVIGAFAPHRYAPHAGSRRAEAAVDTRSTVSTGSICCRGVMLGVEVWAHWYESGHIKRPMVVIAVVMFAVGLLHGSIAARGGAASCRSKSTTPGSPSAAGRSGTSPPPGTSSRRSRSSRSERGWSEGRQGRARELRATCATPPTCARRSRA